MASPHDEMEGESPRMSRSQSVELAKIFINACAAAICFNRDLLPDHCSCFGTRFIGELRHWAANSESYTDFRDLDLHLAPGHSQEFKLLVRSATSRGNQILDLLEYGVFDALEHGYVNAIQFFIAGTPKSPSSVHEKYTLTIRYTGRREHVDGEIHTMELSTPDTTLVVSALSSFKKAIRALLKSLTGLPHLPTEKCLGISLTYTPHCPALYQPKGFLDASDSVNRIGQDWMSLWNTSGDDFAILSTGSHSILLASDRTASNGVTARNTTREDLHVRDQLRMIAKSSSQPSHLIPTQTETALYGKDYGSHNGDQRIGKPQVMQESLRELSMPNARGKKRSDNLHHSAKTTTIKRSEIQKKSNFRGRRQRNLTIHKVAELIVQACAMENNESTSAHVFDIEKLKGGQIIRAQPVIRVRCDCCSNSKEEDMLTCHLCGTLQHADCYGLKSTITTRIPAEHICYTCLLLPHEEDTCYKMLKLVRKRLAVLYLVDSAKDDCRIDDRMLAALRLDSEDPQSWAAASKALGELQEEGYLIKTTNGGWRMIDSKIRQAESNYVDHLAQITDHYCPLKDGQRPDTRLRLIQYAVETYSDGNPYFVGAKNAVYDAVTVLDAFGNEVRRWGYFNNAAGGQKLVGKRSLKRKGSDLWPVSSP